MTDTKTVTQNCPDGGTECEYRCSGCSAGWLSGWARFDYNGEPWGEFYGFPLWFPILTPGPSHLTGFFSFGYTQGGFDCYDFGLNSMTNWRLETDLQPWVSVTMVPRAAPHAHPEPATGVLLMLALPVLWLAHRRRRGS